MKKSKKLRSLLAVVSILSIVFAAQNFITVMADCADSDWYLSGNQTITTNSRRKQTSSSVYFNVDNWGAQTWMANQISVKVVQSSYKPLKRNFTKTISWRGTYAITNWAYEENNAPIDIRLAIWDSNPMDRLHYPLGVSGQWSPDYCNEP